MKTYKYAEINFIISFFLITTYLALWIIGLSFYFCGFEKLLDKINNFGSAKILSLVVGVFVLAPFIFLSKFFFTKTVITIKKDRIIIQKRGEVEKIIFITEIDSMQVNVKEINTLYLYDKKLKELLAVLPTANINSLIEEIPETISELTPFKKNTTTRNFLNTTYESIFYQK
jgi:hypothetical protein